MRDAMNGLAQRVPLLDVRFFITAVAIQRESGGNLSEILDNLSHVVRERFKIQRQVRVHSAHGRITGFVLLALPAALGVALTFINPDHMKLLFEEQMGRTMLMAVIVMQTIGFVWIRKVMKIEV
jgi:tight adherence protein B